jgi:hypothetical protein
MRPTHPRRRSRPAVLAGLLLAAGLLVWSAPPASAHSLGGVEPSDYQTRILAVRPAVPGVSVEVVDAGTRLRLVNRGEREVVVLGYQREPWLRVGPGGSVTWHDHRAHWQDATASVQVRRVPGAAHVTVLDWTVGLRAGDQDVQVVGEVRWVPGPSPLPWLAAALLLAVAVVAAGRAAAWPLLLAGALAALVAVEVLHVAGMWAGVQAPALAKLAAVAVPAVGWAVAALAIRQLLRGRLQRGLVQLLLAAGLLTIVGGIGDLGFLLRSQLAGALPGWVVRAAVTAKLGLGVGVAVAAAVRLRSAPLGRSQASEPAEAPPDVPGWFDDASQPLATVLPWPGQRRATIPDPDLPGGA